jgi:hypothetical protein
MKLEKLMNDAIDVGAMTAAANIAGCISLGFRNMYETPLSGVFAFENPGAKTLFVGTVSEFCHFVASEIAEPSDVLVSKEMN